MMIRTLCRNLGLCAALLAPMSAAAVEIAEYDVLRRFVDEMVTKHQFDRRELLELYRRIELKPSVVEAMQRPAERLPWHRYRQLFITDVTARRGASFWKTHLEDLKRAESRFGVPAEIIVAILGVETRYGKVTGRHRILESLTTLTLQYPRRRKFFRREMKEYLLLSRELGFDPLIVKGSYAGAMGLPQFISSSYRQYAIDFNGNDKRDLINEVPDAIGSVANYLSSHRWSPGQPVVSDLQVRGNAKPVKLVTKGFKPNHTVGSLQARGIELTANVDHKQKLGLLKLDYKDGSRFLAGFDNFYVITRYNRSTNYAMAVYDLSEEIRKQFERSAGSS